MDLAQEAKTGTEYKTVVEKHLLPSGAPRNFSLIDNDQGPMMMMRSGSIVLFCLIKTILSQNAAWPASSYSPYFQTLFSAMASPVAALPTGPGFQAPAIPIPAPGPLPAPAYPLPAYAPPPPPVLPPPSPYYAPAYAPGYLPAAAPGFLPAAAPGIAAAPFGYPGPVPAPAYAPFPGRAFVPAYAPFVRAARLFGANKDKKAVN